MAAKATKLLSSSASMQKDDVAPAADWSEKRWFCFRVQPQKEFVARRLLRNMGLDCFVPVEEKIRRVSRHSKGRKHDATKYPAIRGYTFIGFRGTPSWYELAQIDCLFGVVSFEGRPFSIGNDSVRRLIRLSGTNVPNVISKNLHKAFNIGDKVRINQGSFIDHTVTIESLAENQATTIWDMLGKPTKKIFDLEELDAA
jgi:transcription antitermination factor NusG